MMKSKTPFDPKASLQEFAVMCKKSRTWDGDRHEDGWGVAWKTDRQPWDGYRSLTPVWHDTGSFSRVPKTTILIAHARSASFASQKGTLAYNQPYRNGSLCFVFNGLLHGVTLQAKGTIGAQKIFSLLCGERSRGLYGSVKYVKNVLENHSKRIDGFNIGLSDGNTLAALCRYTSDADSYTLRYYRKEGFAVVCSEPIGNYPFASMRNGEIILL